MGLFIQQNDNRSKLQERLAAELRERAKTQATGSEPLDQSTKSNYVKNTEQLSSGVWVAVVIVGLVILGLGIFMVVR